MSELLIDRQGAVTILTLNRPERRNALTTGMVFGMAEAVEAFADDPGQRVMIVTGAGDKAFCSGADLTAMKERQSDGKDEPFTGRRGDRRLPMSWSPDLGGFASCEKPVICALNGLAVGGGMEIAISCDIRLASDNAYFALPEAAHGFIAGVAAVVLPRLLPFGAVMDMMLSGERLTAKDAHMWGLVQQVTSPDKLMEEAMRRAETMAKRSQPALWGAKQAARYWRDLSINEHQRYYETIAQRVALSGDMFEGLRAFEEKREINYTSGWPNPFDRK